jgi:hypothetical protein
MTEVTRKLNKKRSRNLPGLLNKAYCYGNIRGCRVALYIENQENGEFISFESEKNFGPDQIAAKASRALA